MPAKALRPSHGKRTARALDNLPGLVASNLLKIAGEPINAIKVALEPLERDWIVCRRGQLDCHQQKHRDKALDKTPTHQHTLSLWAVVVQ
jgi:hypothetical protein